MKVLALDISTKTGWALMSGEPGQIPLLVARGLVTDHVEGPTNHPWGMMERCRRLGVVIAALIQELKPDVVVVEQTNMGRARMTQKVLEWIHCNFLSNVAEADKPKVNYIDTVAWRRTIGAVLTKDDKKLNAKVRRLKSQGKKAELKALGVRGRIGKKHVAIRYVNATFGLNLKMKDNDQADSICQATAWFLGCPKSNDQ